MPGVANRISECLRGMGLPMGRDHVDLLVVHRISLANVGIDDDDLDGPKLANAFATNEELKPTTGGRVPYHLLIKPDGLIEQMLPLSIRGTHAKGYNWRSWGVACVGDFRQRPPAGPQTRALTKLLARLVVLTSDARIVGHTQLDGASADVNKICPGSYLLLPSIVKQVVEELPAAFRSYRDEQRVEFAGRFGLTL